MDTHRIDIPERFGCAPGAHVTVRARRSWAARQRVDSAGVKIIPDRDGGTQHEGRIDALARGLAVLETAVLSWEGVRDAEGKPLPASRAGYVHEDFDPELGDWLVDAIDAVYAANSLSGKVPSEAPQSSEP